MGRHCRVPLSDLRAILAEGLGYTDIARATGHTGKQIRHRCIAAGLPVARDGQKGVMPAVSEAEFRALIADSSLTLADIGRRIGTSGAAVFQRARHLGLPTSIADRGVRPRTPKKISDKQLREAVAAGMRVCDIARAYSISRPAVYTRRAALGLGEAA
jgi:hypothetical protein